MDISGGKEIQKGSIPFVGKAGYMYARAIKILPQRNG